MVETVEIVRINFFRTLKISLSVAAIQGVFIQEKRLYPGKDSELFGILISLIPIHAPQLYSSLKHEQHEITRRTNSLATTGEKGIR